MKKVMLFYIAALTFSCSSTDTVPNGSSVNASDTAKYPSVITYDNGMWTSIFNLTFDTTHRLTQIVEHREFSDTDNVFTLSYDINNRLVLIDKLGEEHRTVAFTYDEAGNVSSWKLDDSEPESVTYNNGIYTVDVANIQIFHAFDDMNDITMIESGAAPSTLHYDATKNGAFKNVVGNYQLFALYLDGFLLNFASKKAFLNLATSPYHSYNYTNTYDDEGYVTGFTGICGDGRQPWAAIIYTE